MASSQPDLRDVHFCHLNAGSDSRWSSGAPDATCGAGLYFANSGAGYRVGLCGERGETILMMKTADNRLRQQRSQQSSHGFWLRRSCTYYVPLSGVLSDSGGLERFDFGQIIDGEASRAVRSRRLHHSTHLRFASGEPQVRSCQRERHASVPRNERHNVAQSARNAGRD